MATESFVEESMIRGYHQYKAIWDNQVAGEALVCERGVGNSFNSHAVATKKVIHGENAIVGHVPRRICSDCSLFFAKRRHYPVSR